MRSMGLRTAAQIEADYNAVHTAWMTAVGRKSYTIASGVSRTKVEQEIQSLYDQMMALAQEYDSKSRGGFKMFTVTPSL